MGRGINATDTTTTVPWVQPPEMGSAIEASFVGLVLVVLFIALCRGWYTAEVVVSSP